jgi:hypothetical protein
MVLDDTVRAYNRNAPKDVIHFALTQVVEWRDILLKTQPRKDGEVTGQITMELLQERLTEFLPAAYVTELFQDQYEE